VPHVIVDAAHEDLDVPIACDTGGGIAATVS
jgi:hypothetical protein